MKNLPSFDEFLGEGIYNKDVPHWMRFDRIKESDSYVVNYGFIKVGNMNSENEFFGMLEKEGIVYKKTGINTIEMSDKMAEKLQTIVKPGL